MVIMCIGCVAANAQNTFTQRLQQSKSGEGKVTVSHEQTIDDLVNGTAKQADTQAPQKPDDKPVAEKTDSEKARERLAKILEGEQDDDNVNPDSIVVDTRKKY